jgi:hypothetical protein
MILPWAALDFLRSLSSDIRAMAPFSVDCVQCRMLAAPHDRRDPTVPDVRYAGLKLEDVSPFPVFSRR